MTAPGKYGVGQVERRAIQGSDGDQRFGELDGQLVTVGGHVLPDAGIPFYVGNAECTKAPRATFAVFGLYQDHGADSFGDRPDHLVSAVFIRLVRPHIGGGYSQGCTVGDDEVLDPNNPHGRWNIDAHGNIAAADIVFVKHQVLFQAGSVGQGNRLALKADELGCVVAVGIFLPLNSKQGTAASKVGVEVEGDVLIRSKVEVSRLRVRGEDQGSAVTVLAAGFGGCDGHSGRGRSAVIVPGPVRITGPDQRVGLGQTLVNEDR